MNKLVIGLAGRAGSGKSTCAKWLVEKYGAVEMSLAEPLKRIAMDVFGFTEEQVFGTQYQKEKVDERWGISPRTALIKIGEAARKHLGENIWANVVIKAIADYPANLIVISDVRYPNEADCIRQELSYRSGNMCRGIVIKLICPDASSMVDRLAPSELSVDTIKNVRKVIKAPCSPGAQLLLEQFDQVVLDIFREVGYER